MWANLLSPLKGAPYFGRCFGDGHGLQEFGDNMKILGEGFRKATLQTEYEKAGDEMRQRGQTAQSSAKQNSSAVFFVRKQQCI